MEVRAQIPTSRDFFFFLVTDNCLFVFQNTRYSCLRVKADASYFNQEVPEHREGAVRGEVTGREKKSHNAL